MPVYSFDDAPGDVRAFLARSRRENRDPDEVCKELSRLGVSLSLQMLYLRDGLGLSLKEAKRVVVSGNELDDSWVEEVDRVVSEEVANETARPQEK